MEYITIQIQATEHLRQTPLTPGDIEEILGLLGFSPAEITSAAVTVSKDLATVHWPSASNNLANDAFHGEIDDEQAKISTVPC